MSFRSSFQFLHKTLRGIKSFVHGCGCGNYQKLPKEAVTSLDCVSPREDKEVTTHLPLGEQRRRGERKHKHGRAAKRDDSRDSGGRSRLVIARKMREMERLDLGNIEHVLDVQEVIHYYSLLKCPVYRRIVDEFFAEIYVEFQGDAGDASGR